LVTRQAKEEKDTTMAGSGILANEHGDDPSPTQQTHQWSEKEKQSSDQDGLAGEE